MLCIFQLVNFSTVWLIFNLVSTKSGQGSLESHSCHTRVFLFPVDNEQFITISNSKNEPLNTTGDRLQYRFLCRTFYLCNFSCLTLEDNPLSLSFDHYNNHTCRDSCPLFIEGRDEINAQNEKVCHSN